MGCLESGPSRGRGHIGGCIGSKMGRCTRDRSGSMVVLELNGRSELFKLVRIQLSNNLILVLLISTCSPRMCTCISSEK